ncbi:MAG: hypothetical protein HOG79_16190, partial [Prolixibacteraceae bacterium]|nr:hypothetical protein [Prolixibacteraceae bacterium]
YPRQVTLEPGEAQVVMLQCRRKSNMQAGEYRSHLYFRSEKDYTPLGNKNAAVDTQSLSVQVIPIFGMSIPIIIRSGEVSATTTLNNLKLESDKDNNAYLTFTLNRAGNISVYGNLKVEHIPDRGKPYQIGAVNGVAVYTNLNKRYVSVKLDPTAAANLNSGKIKLSYNSRDDAKRQEVFAEVVRVIQ